MIQASSNPSEQATTGIEHLRSSDPTIRKLIDQVGTLDLRRRLETDKEVHFAALVYGIIAQQIPERMALVIIAKLRTQLGANALTPQNLLALEEGTLHKCGLSPRRENYVRQLANAVVNQELDLQSISQQSDEEVIESLTKQLGIGPFTAHQFVLWQLERPDFLPKQDKFLKQAVQDIYDLPAPPTDPELERIAAPWRPYRTLAVHYLLRSPKGIGVSSSWPSHPPQHDDL